MEHDPVSKTFAEKVSSGEISPPDWRFGGLKPKTPQLLNMETDVHEEPIDWLWEPYCGKGHLVMVDGDPGIGKSLMTIALGSQITKGHPLPNQQGKPTIVQDGPGNVLLLSAEDSLSHTVKKRIRESGGDANKVTALTGWTGEEGEEHFFELQDIDVLEAAMKQVQPTLVVIDPISAYIGKSDMHRSNEMQALLRPLSKLAETYQAVIACVRHPSKPGKDGGIKAIYRGQGSISIGGTARSAIFVEQHPNDPHKVFLCHYKNNQGPLGRTQIYSKAEGIFAWCGVTRLTAEHIAGSGHGPNQHLFLECMLWLEALMGNGVTWSANTIFEHGDGEGYSKDMIVRARKLLGVRATKGASGWEVSLPPLEVIPPTRGGHSSNTKDTKDSYSSSYSLYNTESYTGKNQESEIRQESVRTEELEEREPLVGEDVTRCPHDNRQLLCGFCPQCNWHKET